MTKSMVSEKKQQSLAESLENIKNYNCLKKLIDNNAFDIEIGEDGLIKQK